MEVVNFLRARTRRDAWTPGSCYESFATPLPFRRFASGTADRPALDHLAVAPTAPPRVQDTFPKLFRLGAPSHAPCEGGQGLGPHYAHTTPTLRLNHGRGLRLRCVSMLRIRINKTYIVWALFQYNGIALHDKLPQRADAEGGAIRDEESACRGAVYELASVALCLGVAHRCGAEAPGWCGARRRRRLLVLFSF